MPDLSIMDLGRKAPAANWALSFMSGAATLDVHPRAGLEDVYRLAEERFDRDGPEQADTA